MPKVAPIQDDFSAGEISPRLRGRTRSKEYQTGLAFCENFEVTPQGSLEMRTGTEFIDVIPDIDVFLHTFPRSLNNDIVVVIGQENIRLYDRDGPIQANQFGNLIRDPTFKQGLNLWPVDSLSVGNHTITPNPGSGVTISVTRLTAAAAIGGVTQTFTVPTAGVAYTFRALLTFLSPDGADNLDRWGRIQVVISPVGGGGQAFDVTYNSNNLPPAIGGQVPIDFTITPATTTIKIDLRVIGILAGSEVGTSMKVKFSGLEFIDEALVPTPVIFPTPESWKGALSSSGLPKTGDIQSVADSAIEEMFFTITDGVPHRLLFDSDTNSFEFAEFLPLNNPWDDDYPTTCTIHQGRLWLAGSPEKPSTIWASRVWDYEDFELVGVEPVASDPLEFTLASNGSIQWMDGLKNLLIGTDRGEIIGRSSGPAITGTDFDFSLEQTWGSARIQPRQVGDQVLHVTPDSKRIRGLFDGGDATNGYETEDLTIFAQNIVNDKVIDLTFARSPDYKISAVLSNGRIISATRYMRGDKPAWFRFRTNGFVISQTETTESAGTSIFYIIRRVNGDDETAIFLEIKNADTELGANMDSYLSVDYEASDFRIISGLDHLNGFECSIVLLINNEFALHDPRTPVNGEIQLDPWVPESGQAIVGIPFVATATTLPLEGSSNAGTAQVQRRRYNEVFLRLYDSAIPMINGHRPPIRTPDTPMGISQPLFTGDTAVHQVGWDDGVITITQDLPLPTKISAIFGNAKGNSV